MWHTVLELMLLSMQLLSIQLPGHAIVQFFPMTARPRAAMAWLFGEWRPGSSVLEFSEGLRELPTRMHSCRKRKAKSKCSSERRPQTPTYIHTYAHKQNYDQRTGWLAGWRNNDQGACPALCWLAGWGAGWLAEAQRGPERRSLYRTSLSMQRSQNRPAYQKPLCRRNSQPMGCKAHRGFTNRRPSTQWTNLFSAGPSS